MEIQSFSLRRSLQPYVGLGIIGLILLIFTAWVGISKNDWGAFWSILVLFGIFYTIFVIFGMSYRIFYSDNVVSMKPASFFSNPSLVTKISVAKITSVEQETSNVQTLAKMSRPFRRISIYGSTSEGMKKIDVSLKHFNLDDIRKLMKIIHDLRPDLAMPKDWI